MAYQDIIPILKLDKAAMDKVANDDKAIQDSNVIIAISAFAASILGMLVQQLIGATGFGELFGLSQEYNIGMMLGMAILSALLSIAFFWLGMAIFHWIATWFGGQGSIKALYKVLGHAQGLRILAWIPVLNFIIGIWLIVVNINGVAQVEKLTTGKAAAVVLIPLAIVFALVFAFMILVFGLLYAGAGTGALL